MLYKVSISAFTHGKFWEIIRASFQLSRPLFCPAEALTRVPMTGEGLLSYEPNKKRIVPLEKITLTIDVCM